MAAVRAKQLLDAGAHVTLIAPDVQAELEALGEKARLEIVRRTFERSDITLDYFIVIGATDDASVQRALAEEAGRQGILCNVVDAPALCSFYTPAVVERGDLKIAISTHGQSPLLAGRIRQWLEEALPKEMEALTAAMGHLRSQLKVLFPGDLEKQKEWLAEFLERALKK